MGEEKEMPSTGYTILEQGKMPEKKDRLTPRQRERQIQKKQEMKEYIYRRRYGYWEE